VPELYLPHCTTPFRLLTLPSTYHKLNLWCAIATTTLALLLVLLASTDRKRQVNAKLARVHCDYTHRFRLYFQKNKGTKIKVPYFIGHLF
jgi:hypothetical protein